MTEPDHPGPPPLDLEALYQQAPCGYLTTSDDGTISNVNETFLTWTGYRRDEVIGVRLQKLMPIGDQILYSTHCTPLLLMVGRVAEIAIEIVGKDRQRQSALLSASRSAATEGRPALTRVVIFSAHERRRYEKELVGARRRAEESEARRVDVEADLQHLALHDPLTGLLNRAGLNARLHESTSSDLTVPDGLSVFVVDLDHFQAVNDSLGQAAGDELLIVVARRLGTVVRASGSLARVSGDEFVLVEHLAETEQASSLAQRMLEALEPPVTIDGLEIVVSASIGIAVAAPDSPADSAEQLLRRASIAMYKTKARGRSSWMRHELDPANKAVDRLRLLGELRVAIKSDELRLHYQPRVDPRTGELHGVEALVRWQHPTRGLLAPAEFVAVAEESGLMPQLGAWVLDEAIGQAMRWRDQPEASEVEMAVNLSTRQLGDPHLVDLVADILNRHGLDPRRLTLEITETALMADPAVALLALLGLKALGCGLAIDDFGTGYASLTYLKSFPIDELKIDQSFVAGLGTDPSDSAIVASCVLLAHALGLRAVAEGVETASQRDALNKLDCDLAQGYFYTRPLPPAELTAWDRRRREMPPTAPGPTASVGP